MTDYFEEIKAYLISDKVRPRKELHKLLKDIGYIPEDDFYILERNDEVMPWQTEELLTLDIKLGDAYKYETEEDIEDGRSSYWNEMEVSYLMATMPRENLCEFVDRVDELVNKLSLKLVFDGSEMNISSFKTTLEKIADELADKYAPAGSEELALLIEDDYN